MDICPRSRPVADPFAAPALRDLDRIGLAGRGQADQSLDTVTDQRNSGNGTPQRPLERHVKDEQQG